MMLRIENKIIKVFLFLIVLSSSVLAEKKLYYEHLDKRQTSEMLKSACENEQNPQVAACIELGLLYQQFTEKKFKKEKQPSLFSKDRNGDPKLVTYQALGKEYLKLSCQKYNSKEACGILKGEDRFQGSELLVNTSYVLIFGAVLWISLMVFQDNEKFAAQEKLEDGESDEKQKSKFDQFGIILKYSRPFFKRYFTPIVEGMKGRSKLKDKYKRTLAGAGLTDIMSPEDFFAFKLFLIIGFPIVFLGVRQFMEADWPLAAIPLVAGFGFQYPDIWAKGLIEKRQKDIVAGMPFAVDMLALSVEAGLDYMQAMAKVIEKSRPGPLTDEFSIVIKENRLGAPKSTALRNMAWRVDLMQISSFCATLVAADSVGANIGPILKALSVEIRQKKSAQIEKDGQTAATKILFPMMLFIVPAVFVMIGAPLALEAMNGGK